jgi:hypothetical protein
MDRFLPLRLCSSGFIEPGADRLQTWMLQEKSKLKQETRKHYKLINDNPATMPKTRRERRNRVQF